jgi:hypothetical protein
MLTLFTGGRADDDSRQELIQSIARSVCSETMTQLTPSASAMPLDELRGYVRTRAASIAREHVRQAIADRRLAPTLLSELTAAVIDRTVHLAVRSSVTMPIVAIPQPHVRIRKAA